MNNGRRSTWGSRFAALVLLVGLAGTLPGLAWAARVYGRVMGPNGKPVVRGTLNVFGARGESIRSITTSDAGRYSVFLKPGLYRVEMRGIWEASLQSFEEATEQDIWLTVKRH